MFHAQHPEVVYQCELVLPEGIRTSEQLLVVFHRHSSDLPQVGCKSLHSVGHGGRAEDVHRHAAERFGAVHFHVVTGHPTVEVGGETRSRREAVQLQLLTVAKERSEHAGLVCSELTNVVGLKAVSVDR